MTTDSNPLGTDRAAFDFAARANSSPDLFDIMPMALWLEDYSALKQLLEGWRQDGVTDLRAYFKADPARVTECAQSIRVLRVNQATLSLYGASSVEHIIKHLGSVLRDETYDAFVSEMDQLWSGKAQFQSRTVNYTVGGERLDLSLKGVIVPGHESDWGRVLVVVENITELARMYRQLLKEEAYSRGIFEQSPVSLWVEDYSVVKQLLDEVRDRGISDFRTFTDVHPEFVERCLSEIKVLDVNEFTLKMFKAPHKNDVFQGADAIFGKDMLKQFREQLVDLWDGKLFQQREAINHALDGTPISVHMQLSVFEGFEDDWSLVLLALTDITARKKAEAYLEYLGKHDVLTKLKNRSYFVDELSRLERKGPAPVSLITLDMNNLKQINDRLGHAAGDALLRRAGEILAKAVDLPAASVCRVGGDEFVILMPGQLEDIALDVMANVRRLTDLNNQFYSGPKVHFSMGHACTWDRDRLEAALREADQAMYEDKRRYYEEHGIRRRASDFEDGEPGPE